jgi:hypothetical protein
MVISASLEKKLQLYIQGDLRKLNFVCKLYQTRREYFTNHGKLFCNMFITKVNIDDSKKITHSLLHRYIPFSSHGETMNETDRTIVALLWHENIIDSLSQLKLPNKWQIYLDILEKICFADYIDRITFQNQIWQFNEMSSLIKTFKNNKLFHDSIKKKPKYNPSEVRFTKVLTKYSTEYNNSIFIQNLCQQLGMDKKDLFCFFLNIKNKYSEQEILALFENYEITKLDINRIYRYLEKYTKEDSLDIEDDVISISSSDF